MVENKCKQKEKTQQKLPSCSDAWFKQAKCTKKIIFDSLKRLQLLAWGTWDKYQQYPNEQKKKKNKKVGGMEDMQNNYEMFSKIYTLQRLL